MSHVLVGMLCVKENAGLLKQFNIALKVFARCKMHIEGSRPEWCISSMIYSRDTPVWSESLDMFKNHFNTTMLVERYTDFHLPLTCACWVFV